MEDDLARKSGGFGGAGKLAGFLSQNTFSKLNSPGLDFWPSCERKYSALIDERMAIFSQGMDFDDRRILGDSCRFTHSSASASPRAKSGRSANSLESKPIVRFALDRCFISHARGYVARHLHASNLYLSPCWMMLKHIPKDVQGIGSGIEHGAILIDARRVLFEPSAVIEQIDDPNCIHTPPA